MTEKILWLDLETTGLDPQKNGVVQISGLIDIDGELKHTFNYKVSTDKELEPKALEITGLTAAKIKRFPPPKEVFAAFKALLETFVDPFDPGDKFRLAGYNVSFDLKFLKSFFELNSSPFLFSYITHDLMDISLIIQTAQNYFGKSVIPTWKLGPTCAIFDVPIEAHDALSDITATRNLHYALKAIFQGGK
jgi:DNA polymerase III subunit epsilon